jgi:hypothetical protein
MKRLPQQIVKVKNYGNDWINRLAVVGDQFEKMEGSKEQAAALRFILSKYGDVLEEQPQLR